MYPPQKSPASEIGSQELTGAPRAHFQIDGPRTVALRKLQLEEKSDKNLKIGELNTNIFKNKFRSSTYWDVLVWSAMRQLYADMYRSTSTIVECTTLYMMSLDLNLFLEFHRSECQLDLQRIYIFQGHSTAAAGFSINWF